MLSCSVVLLLMGSAYIIFEYISFRETVKKNISTLGVVIASNSTAALAFDSQKDAGEILNALRADKHIVSASLYDSNGDLFARYPEDLSQNILPSGPGESGYNFKGSFLEGFQPVVQKNLLLGTLYIKSDLTSVYDQMRFNILIAVSLIIGSLVVAYILSGFLQKTISKPVLALERTARIVSEKHDYSTRAVKKGDDELGSLTDAFNHMLTQIEAQNLEIIKANEESSKLAAIVESSGDAIIGSTLSLIITSWNLSAERIFGYTADEMIGQPLEKIVSEEQQNLVHHVLAKLKKEEQADSFEVQFLNKAHKLLDISLTISPVKNSEGNITGVSHIARDISVQKQNERLIIENEEHLRLATQAAELGTFDIDLINGTRNWDKRCRELFDIYTDEPLTFEEHFLNRLHEDDRERIAKTIEAVFNKKLSGGNYDVEYRTVGRDKKVRWIRAKGRAFFNEEEKPLRFIGTVLDITRSKQEELRKNDFIAIISHELKTPLTTIKSYIQILLSKARKENNEFVINALTRADSQTNKMTSMIKDFLSLARIEEGKIKLVKEVFELRLLIGDIVSEAYLLHSSHIIRVENCSEVKINADRDKIGQVLSNLLSNAIKYSPANSKITIGCEKNGSKVKIYVRDEGVGISPGDQKSLFNRFYRVDNEKVKTVSGFGIGLYIVSEILRYHNSTIMVESTEGAGSVFYFSLDIYPGT